MSVARMGLRDAALFPGFEGLRAGAVAARVAGPLDAPAALLIHGYPQTGAIWAVVAAALRASASPMRLVIPDLPGYGHSRDARYAAGPDPERGAKRRMAAELVALMRALGHERFHVAGHDRGGRVAYRLALDHPDRVARLATLDILPTIETWPKAAEAAAAVDFYHWMFLAQPHPLPERLIAGAPDYYIDQTLASWSGTGDLTPFSPAALESYRANARDPLRLAAMCDDYRAGATLDVAHDAADQAAGRRIAAPMLALWGGQGLAQRAEDGVLDVWRRWADAVDGAPMNCGHFLPEEAPDAVADRLATFFAGA